MPGRFSTAATGSTGLGLGVGVGVTVAEFLLQAIKILRAENPAIRPIFSREANIVGCLGSGLPLVPKIIGVIHWQASDLCLNQKFKILRFYSFSNRNICFLQIGISLKVDELLPVYFFYLWYD